jgi:fermentation-respiration switch protein FrsA (DUF1100 family)
MGTLAKRPSRETYGNLTLMSPFKSVRDMVKTKTKIIPQFIINWLTNSWNNLEALPKLKGRINGLKIIHGKNDGIVPCQQGQDLHKLAQTHSINSEFVELAGAGHNDMGRV